VEEQSDGAGITPAALGWVGYTGLLEKGPVNKLSICATSTLWAKRHGGIIPESLLPDAAQDFYNLANGAGGIATVRVTDGNEVPAQMVLYARIAGTQTVMGLVQAANGGRWGGKWKRWTAKISNLSQVAQTTLTTNLTNAWKTDEWKGGWLIFDALPNAKFAIVGNTSAGVITVSADSTMATAMATQTDLRYYLTLDNTDGQAANFTGSKALSLAIADGQNDSDGEFSFQVYVDGSLVDNYDNLNCDPSSPNYWVNVINNDQGNDEITVTDEWTGAYTPSVRPANVYGMTTAALSQPTVLTAVINEFSVNSVGGGDPTFALGTVTDAHLPQIITVTMTSATQGTVKSDRYGSFTGTLHLGTLFTPDVAWAPPFTLTAGGTALAANDTITIVFKPLMANTLVGGYLYPDKVNAKRTKFRIVANDHNTITIAGGNDMTMTGNAGSEATEFMVVAPQEFTGGRDGNADISDAAYTSVPWDTNASPYNDLIGLNLGLVKMATPGITSTTVQNAGKAYCEAKNYQYRVEVPSNIGVNDDFQVIEYINDTLGRSDMGVVTHPSYGYVPDPDPIAANAGKMKLISLTGMIHGREASMAANWQGYHKAEAGQDATLPRLLRLPTGTRKLDEEDLNPVGIGIIKKSAGNYVLWGDRTICIDTTWTWKHQREQMSYYEHVFLENFDWIVFAINDSQSDNSVKTALNNFFLPEWNKRALQGTKFTDAAVIKVDSELNTPAVRAAGNKIASVTLWLADTTERLIIRIGKQGIFTAPAS